MRHQEIAAGIAMFVVVGVGVALGAAEAPADIQTIVISEADLEAQDAARLDRKRSADEASRAAQRRAVDEAAKKAAAEKAAAEKAAAKKKQQQASAPAPAKTSTRKSTTGGSVWDRLAQCESGGNWSINTGKYDGGLQFLPSTWTSYKPSGYPKYAWQASREQQITVAEKVKSDVGWRAWPACTSELGLR